MCSPIVLFSTLMCFSVAGLALDQPISAQTERKSRVNGAFYRNETPLVLAPPAPTPRAEDAVLQRFRSAYSARKQPRLAVFWNRQLSDQVATTYRDGLRIRSTGGAESTRTHDETRSLDGVTSMTQNTSSFDKTTDIDRRDGPINSAPRRPGFAELNDWQFENGFTNAFLNAGGRLIDRNLIIRGSAEAKNPDGRPNLQGIEAAALAAKADLLMEVLQTPDQTSPSGFAFRVAIKDLKSGMIVTNVVSRAVPREEGPPRYVATNQGFERATQSYGVDDVGNTLALETMSALLGVWR